MGARGRKLGGAGNPPRDLGNLTFVLEHSGQRLFYELAGNIHPASEWFLLW